MIRTFGLALLVSFLISMNCKHPADGDLRYAASVLGAANRIKAPSATSRSGTGGAVTALTSAGSGLSTGAAVGLIPPAHRALLAYIFKKSSRRQSLQELVQNRRNISRPRAIPTDFLCNGIACVAGTGLTMSGSDNCDVSGTVQALPTFSVDIVDDGSLFTYTINSGNFLYTNCVALGVDFNNYPDFTQRTLKGTVHVDGEMKSTLLDTDVSLAGFFISDTTVTTTTGDNFFADGTGPIVMDISLNQIDSVNVVFDSNTGDVFAGIASGTITAFGTINGQTIDIDTSYTESF